MPDQASYLDPQLHARLGRLLETGWQLRASPRIRLLAEGLGRGRPVCRPADVEPVRHSASIRGRGSIVVIPRRSDLAPFQALLALAYLTHSFRLVRNSS